MTPSLKTSLTSSASRLVSLLAGCVIALGAWPACASNASEAPPPQSGKTGAPVVLALASSAPFGEADVTLSVRAGADIPRAVARFVLPPGVMLVAGALEQELGSLARDELRAVVIRVQIPARGRFMLAAGVDCHLGERMKLHGSITTTVGAPEVGPTVPERVDQREPVRPTLARRKLQSP